MQIKKDNLEHNLNHMLSIESFFMNKFVYLVINHSVFKLNKVNFIILNSL